MRKVTASLPVGKRAEGVGAFVVTFRRPRQLTQSLGAIYAQTTAPATTVVLNNGPRIDAPTVLAREAAGVTTVNLNGNTGSAGGFATALRLAYNQGLTWAWLFDDDVLPYPATLRQLLEAVEESRNDAEPIGIVAPLQVSSRGTFGVATWNGMAFEQQDPADDARPYPVDVTCWGGMLVHRRVIERIGYPRSDFFRCFADYEYCLRARRAGLRILAVPSAKVRHDHGSPTVVVRLGRRSLRFDHSPERNYYHARNAAYTMRFLLRSPLAILHHALHEGRLGIGDIVYSEHRAQRIWLRCRGLVDGFFGRLGRLDDR